jgi:acyl dehydratase
MTHLYFEDAEVGTTCQAGPYLVPKEEIIQFAKQYDPVPRHIDEEAAARSIFRGLTACSAHTFSIFILLTTRLQPRLHVLAGMGWDELRLPNPVRPGDELDLQTALMEKRESKSKPEQPNPIEQSKGRNRLAVHLQRSHCKATRVCGGSLRGVEHIGLNCTTRRIDALVGANCP